VIDDENLRAKSSAVTVWIMPGTLSRSMPGPASGDGATTSTGGKAVPIVPGSEARWPEGSEDCESAAPGSSPASATAKIPDL
jgi:hypothetical protein